MAKRKERIQNPEPFVPDGTDYAKLKKRSKAPKHHQKEEKLIASNISSKIMKEALIQQRELQEEEDAEDLGNTKSSFHGVDDLPLVKEDDDDIDNFAGFSETQSQFGGYEEEINEEDERLMEAFLSKEPGCQKTLADIIVQRIKQKDVSVASENRPVPKLDKSIIDIYKGVATHLSKYTVGKIPKAFKHIPSMQLWEEVLYITEPENWSPNALYQATRIFASNFGSKKAERFYKLVLLPRVREDMRKNKRLHFALYQTLKKALYKPSAFFKGILFPLCESRTCTLREAVIIGSIIEKVSIPPLHSRYVNLVKDLGFG
ncbi:Bystin [Sesbania bispinosa]|nr:Bystin [Sesbania bispinosa]